MEGLLLKRWSAQTLPESILHEIIIIIIDIELVTAKDCLPIKAKIIKTLL